METSPGLSYHQELALKEELVRLAAWPPAPAGSCQTLTLCFTLWAGEKAAGVMGIWLVAVPQQPLALDKHKDRVAAEISSLSSGKAMD